jgi:hypothetical protein
MVVRGVSVALSEVSRPPWVLVEMHELHLTCRAFNASVYECDVSLASRAGRIHVTPICMVILTELLSTLKEPKNLKADVGTAFIQP